MKTPQIILRELDRLTDNPYFPSDAFLADRLKVTGGLVFVVFVCPKMEPRYLETPSIELYMPVTEPKDGLLTPRIPKLLQLFRSLKEVGVPAKFVFLVGDNDYEVYKGPPLGIILDSARLDVRREQYLDNLYAQMSKLFPKAVEVKSLGLMRVGTYNGDVYIPADMLQREVDFQRWTFEKFFNGKVPSDAVLRKIAELKIRAYARQGHFIQDMSGILISTEGTNLDSWTQRTKMFEVGGARFPCLYPYIRKEVLQTK